TRARPLPGLLHRSRRAPRAPRDEAAARDRRALRRPAAPAVREHPRRRAPARVRSGDRPAVRPPGRDVRPVDGLLPGGRALLRPLGQRGGEAQAAHLPPEAGPLARRLRRLLERAGKAGQVRPEAAEGEVTTTAAAFARARAGSLAERVDARVVVLVVLYAYFMALIAVGGHDHWDRFYVPDLSPAFLDLRSVTSAWECTRKGIEVLASNPCDPWGRPANYPRLWLVPSSLGLGQSSTVPLGLVTAILFFGSFLLIVLRRTGTDGLLLGLALVSQVVMFVVERGTADLLL